MGKYPVKWPGLIYQTAIAIWGGLILIFLIQRILFPNESLDLASKSRIIYFLIPYLLIVIAYFLNKLYRSYRSQTLSERQGITENALYQSIFENTSDAILLLTGLIIKDCNTEACKLFNRQKSDLAGQFFYNLSPPYQSDGSESIQKLSEITEQIKTSLQVQFDWQFLQNPNSLINRNILANCINLQDKNYIQIFIRNSSHAEATKDSISDSQDKFELIFNSVTDGITIISEEMEVLEANDRILNRLNMSREAFNKLPPGERFPESIMMALPGQFQKFKDSPEFSFDLENIKLQGQVTTLEVRVKKITFNSRPAFIAVSRDISDKKLSQHQIYNAVIKAEENERTRLAKELHDGISPLLSISKLYAQSALDCKDDSLRVNILRRVESTIDESIQSITEISNNLSPHILENFGLIAAVEAFSHKINELKSLQIKIESNIRGRLDGNIEITLYRIITEMINNTLRHAQAQKVYIELTQNDLIHLIYRDDGIGFNFQEILRRKKGMGVYNIVNRIKSLNGHINFMNSSTKGILISATIPVYVQ